MSDYSLGTARGEIRIDYAGRDAVRQAEQDLGRVGDAGDNTSDALRKSSTAAGVLGAGIVAGLGVAVKTASDFEHSMSAVGAVLGANSDEMEALRAKALQLGKDTAFSAGESAQAMEELAKAGLTTTDILGGAADATVALAAAGAVDMPTAAGIATAAMNSYNIAGKDAAKVADLFAGAANRSATDVTGIGEAFKYVAPLAASTGVTIEDTTTAIAALAKAGISGSMAGTTLRAMLQNLQPASKGAAQAMKELGIITKDGQNQFYNADGSMKSMAEVSGILQKALSGLSDQQKSQALTTIFGARAMTGALALAKQGEKGFTDLGEAIGKVSAEKVAEDRMNNLSGSMEQLSGSVETFSIQIGSVLIPFLTKLVNKLTGVTNWFINLSDTQKQMIVIGAGVVASLLLTFAAVVKITMAVQRAIKVFKILQAAFMGLKAVKAVAAAFKIAAVAVKGFTLSLLTNPVFLIIAAIVALVAALVLLYKKNETFRNFVNAAWASIQAAIGAVVGWLTGTAWPAIQAVWDGIVSGAQAMWSGVVTAWNAIVTAITTVVQVIVTIITTYVNMWKTIITTVLAAIIAVWNAYWGLVGPLIKAVFDLVMAIIKFAIAWALVFIRSTLQAIAAVWSAIWNAISAVASAVWDAITAVISRAVNVIKRVITVVFNAVKSVVTTIWNAIRSVTVAAWNAVYKAVSGPINKAKSIVSSVVGTIKSLISTGFNAAKDATVKAFGLLYGAVKDKMGDAYSKVKDIVGKIKGYFTGAGTWLKDAGRRLIQGLIDGITGMISKVTDAIGRIASKIKNAMPGSPVKEGPLVAWNDGSPGRKLVEMLAKGIRSNLGVLNDAFEGLYVEVPSSLTAPEVALAGSASRTRGLATLPQAPATASTANGPLIGTQYVYNPRPEPASQEATRQATRAALLGGPR